MPHLSRLEPRKAGEGRGASVVMDAKRAKADVLVLGTTLDSQEIRLQLGVAVVGGPEIQRNRSEFVDDRQGEAIFR